MELCLRITRTLVLLVLCFHGALVQDAPETTDTPRRTIDQTWLRNRVPLSDQAAASDWPAGEDQTLEESGAESGNDMSGGIASGYMSFTDDKSNDTTDQTPIFPSGTASASENRDDPVATTAPAADANATATTANSTAAPEHADVLPPSSNDTDAQSSTPAPETNATAPDPGIESTTGAENNPTTTNGGAVVPEWTERGNVTRESGTASPPTTASPDGTATASPSTSPSAEVAPDHAGLSDKGAEAGTEERGYGSESERRRRKSAWGAVLGTFVAVAVVGLVAYVILKKKHHKAFSHRKLEEEFPSDPVLRLDNSEPLDLNFGRAAYYNPTSQGDNIQMSPFPKN